MKSFRLFSISKAGTSQLQELFNQIDLLLDSARKVYTQSEELKKVVEQNKRSVQKSSAAAHEISSMGAMTAKAAEDLSLVANSSHHAVEQSSHDLKALTEMISTVDQESQKLQKAVKSGLEEISSVTETMAEIRSKAKMINEVVFQTKLLSFNASVEAARAGEHGKGFSVVAEEMENLARASGQSAKEIETILNQSVDRTHQQIERVTRELENAAQNTVKAIELVARKTSDIADSFKRLEDFSEQTDKNAKEISSATSEQKIGVLEISHSLEELESSSDTLDHVALEENKSAAELASRIEQISEEYIRILETLGYKVTKPQKEFDFEAAIKAHVDWKMKLSRYLKNPDNSLDHKVVCKDNTCALGQWMYGEGQAYKAFGPDLFETVRSSHAEFHKAAGEIVRMINVRDFKAAERLLGPSGSYLKISSETVRLLTELSQLKTKQKAA